MATAISVLRRHIQVISTELMDALKASASKHGVSVDTEITVRLMAFLSKPELTEDNTLSQQILRKKFTAKEAFDECKRNHEATRYLFEIEKLRNFLHFEATLPRYFKENFTLIDVEEESKRIKAELEAEDEKNRE